MFFQLVYDVVHRFKTTLLHVTLLWFSQFFLYVTFFFLAQLYQRHDLLPRTIQYNMYKFSTNSTKYISFSLVS